MSFEQTLARIPDMFPAQREQLRVNAERWLATGDELQQDQAREVIEALDAQEEAEQHDLAVEEITARSRP